MAYTYQKRHPRIQAPSDAWLGYMALQEQEAASQTFVESAPVVFASGYISTGANPATAIAAFALEAGHNGTAGQYKVKILPALPEVHVVANLLGSAAADFTLTAASLGDTVRYALSATLLGAAEPGWYFDRANSGSEGIKVVSFRNFGDSVVPNTTQGDYALVGDINARVLGSVLAAANGWFI